MKSPQTESAVLLSRRLAGLGLLLALAAPPIQFMGSAVEDLSSRGLVGFRPFKVAEKVFRPLDDSVRMGIFLAGIGMMVASWVIRTRSAPNLPLLPDSIGSGVVLASILFVAGFLVTFQPPPPLLFDFLTQLAFAFPWVQLAYSISAMAITYAFGHRETAKGLRIAIGIMLLLFVTCQGVTPFVMDLLFSG